MEALVRRLEMSMRAAVFTVLLETTVKWSPSVSLSVLVNMEEHATKMIQIINALVLLVGMVSAVKCQIHALEIHVIMEECAEALVALMHVLVPQDILGNRVKLNPNATQVLHVKMAVYVGNMDMKVTNVTATVDGEEITARFLLIRLIQMRWNKKQPEVREWK